MEVTKVKVENGIILYNKKQYITKKIVTDIYTRYMIYLPMVLHWLNVNNLSDKTRKELVNKIENENLDR